MEANTTVRTFTNESLGAIRTIEIDGIVWFVAIDVATILGYANPRDAIKKHVDDEDKNTVAIRDGIAGNPNTTVINESGLYSLILSSKLPKAKDFKRWVTSEVLPALRQSGFYSLVGTPESTDILEEERPTKEITPHEYLQIAKIIASCKTDRLPMVLRILEKGGWELEKPQELVKIGISDTSDAGMRIEAAAKKLGIGISKLAELINWHRTILSRYVNHQCYPRPKTYVKLLHDLDMVIELYGNQNNELELMGNAGKESDKS